MDAILQTMGQRLEKLKLAIEASSGGESPNKMTVALKRALFGVFEPVGLARDFMEGLLAHESGTQHRPQLQEVFGGDCHRIARISAVLDLITELLQRRRLSRDDRLTSCRSRCESVMSVLKDSGLSERLAQAEVEEKEKVEEMVASRDSTPVAGLPVFHGLGPAEEEEPSLPSPSRRKTLIAQIDGAETSHAVLDHIDTLFEEYDNRGTGLVEGKAYEAAISDLTAHVRREAEEVMKKYDKPMTLPSEELLRQWVMDVVDPNHDGAITREEARIGFKQVVDDIETGGEYERRRSTIKPVASD